VANAVKMVLPAPTRIAARKIRRLTAQGRPLYLGGRLMGGGAVTQAVRRHLAQGLPVFADPGAALTFNDRLEVVQQWGVVLTEEPPAEAVEVALGDVDTEGLGTALAAFEVPFPRRFAVAVQDHGFYPEGSNRRFRFQYWEQFLARQGTLEDLAFREPPPFFTRMRAVAETLPGALLMDTCAAGIRGALLDEQIRERIHEGVMAVNLGNAHTFAALVRGPRLYGIYEHHTGLLDRIKLFDHLKCFQAGVLTNEEVFADKGHGCAYAPDFPGGDGFGAAVITGPRRRLARGWPGVFAAPYGDMMLTGCFGLIAAYLEMEKLPLEIRD
jgi:uncharacterized protein (DUF1786 family)